MALAHALHSPEFHLVTPGQVKAAHAAGLQVLPWTADTPADWKRLLDAGVDGIISDDPAATAKRLSEVARSTRILAVKGGVMNGHTLTAEQIRELGDLPPRPTLLSQVVGAVNGPVQGTVGVLNAPLRDIAALLDAYIAKRETAETAA